MPAAAARLLPVPGPAPALSNDALGERITELSAHIQAATCRLLELIAEFDERCGWAD